MSTAATYVKLKTSPRLRFDLFVVLRAGVTWNNYFALVLRHQPGGWGEGEGEPKGRTSGHHGASRDKEVGGPQVEVGLVAAFVLSN